MWASEQARVSLLFLDVASVGWKMIIDHSTHSDRLLVTPSFFFCSPLIVYSFLFCRVASQPIAFTGKR